MTMRRVAMALTLVGAGVILGLSLGELRAQDGADAAKKPTAAQIAAKKKKLALKMVDLENSGDFMKTTMDQFMDAFATTPGLPAGFTEKFKETVDVQELLDLVVPIYEKHLSVEEMEASIAWMESRMGQALLAKRPKIQTESMQVGQTWGQQKAMQVLQEMAK